MKIRHETQKIEELYNIKDDILLNPAWQRGPVWSQQKQSLLIDSILRGYDIPMIYMRNTPSGSPYDFEVVDGQQRLRAIWAFIDGDYALSPNIEDVNKHKIAGKVFSDLSPAHKGKINKFPVVVAYVSDAREPEISRLFSRMQMGVRLNPPELRNAVQAPLRHAVDGLAREHPFFKQSRINANRFKHQDYLSHAFSMCFHEASVDLKAPQLIEDYENVTDPDKYQPVIASIMDILDFLKLVNERCGKRITQKWIFVDLVYLLYSNIEKLKFLSAEEFAKIHDSFDRGRLEHNAKPEDLLAESPVPSANRDLYKYIQAFKIGGGEEKNLAVRYRVLTRRYKKLLVSTRGE